MLGLKTEKQLRNKGHTEDLAPGFHPRDNGQVTHYAYEVLSLYKYIMKLFWTSPHGLLK